jgi:hypothetical protein
MAILKEKQSSKSGYFGGFFFSQKMLFVSLTGYFWSPKTENSPPLTHQPKNQKQKINFINK